MADNNKKSYNSKKFHRFSYSLKKKDFATSDKKEKSNSDNIGGKSLKNNSKSLNIDIKEENDHSSNTTMMKMNTEAISPSSFSSSLSTDEMDKLERGMQMEKEKDYNIDKKSPSDLLITMLKEFKMEKSKNVIEIGSPKTRRLSMFKM